MHLTNLLSPCRNFKGNEEGNVRASILANRLICSTVNYNLNC